MRSRVEPGGWQANSVAVKPSVWSMMRMASGVDHLGAGDLVDEPALERGEDHLVADVQLVDVAERAVVAGAVAGDDHVAAVAGHRRARPVAGTVVEHRQRHTLEHRSC